MGMTTHDAAILHVNYARHLLRYIGIVSNDQESPAFGAQFMEEPDD